MKEEMKRKHYVGWAQMIKTVANNKLGWPVRHREISVGSICFTDTQSKSSDVTTLQAIRWHCISAHNMVNDQCNIRSTWDDCVELLMNQDKDVQKYLTIKFQNFQIAVIRGLIPWKCMHNINPKRYFSCKSKRKGKNCRSRWIEVKI